MKARVKATGEIVDIAYTYNTVGKNPISKCETLEGKRYNEDDLDFNIEDDNTPDYWTRLEHTYAGMAMQGILTDEWGSTYISNPKSKEQHLALVTNAATEIAHALVEKMKEERK